MRRDGRCSSTAVCTVCGELTDQERIARGLSLAISRIAASIDPQKTALPQMLTTLPSSSIWMEKQPTACKDERLPEYWPSGYSAITVSATIDKI